MVEVHPARHLLRAKDLADARYREPLTVSDLARAANLSPAHFSREFRRAFGESPHQYVLTRRLERAASLLRTTDWPIAEVCFAVGLRSIGSFTTSFRRIYGRPPLVYRAEAPPGAHLVRIPDCVARAYGRPANRRSTGAASARSQARRGPATESQRAGQHRGRSEQRPGAFLSSFREEPALLSPYGRGDPTAEGAP